MKVVVIDSDEISCIAIRSMLSQVYAESQIDVYVDRSLGYREIRNVKPDLLIVGASSALGKDLVRLKRIRSYNSDIKILLLVEVLDVYTGKEVLRTSANGLLLKSSFGQLLDTVNCLESGGGYVDPKFSYKLIMQSCINKISYEEYSVIKLLSEAKSISHISRVTGIMERRIYRIRDRVLAVLEAETISKAWEVLQ